MTRNKHLGEGSFGVVTHIAQGKCALKKLKENPFSINDDESNGLINEFNIAKDLNLIYTPQLQKNHNPIKHGIPYKYLGKSLDRIKFESYTIPERYALAIKTAVAVVKLHTGENSKSNRKYAHRDIKPPNITLDSTNRIHLIDFGNAKQLTEKRQNNEGTFQYLPRNYQNYTNKQLDEFALLRTIYTPKHYASSRWKRNATRIKATPTILSDQIFEEDINLQNLLDTHESQPKKYSAKQIAIYLFFCQYKSFNEKIIEFIFRHSGLSNFIFDTIANETSIDIQQNPTANLSNQLEQIAAKIKNLQLHATQKIGKSHIKHTRVINFTMAAWHQVLNNLMQQKGKINLNIDSKSYKALNYKRHHPLACAFMLSITFPPFFLYGVYQYYQSGGEKFLTWKKTTKSEIMAKEIIDDLQQLDRNSAKKLQSS